MTPQYRGQHRAVLAAALLAVVLLLATGCGSTIVKPDVEITIGENTTTVSPTLYCVDGQASLADESAPTATVQVEPNQPIDVEVPDSVAQKTWAIQIWSVRDSDGASVPSEQIGNIPVGTETSFDGFTTSDAAPSRYFVIVVIPEDPGCTAKGAAGIWPLLVSRTG